MEKEIELKLVALADVNDERLCSRKCPFLLMLVDQTTRYECRLFGSLPVVQDVGPTCLTKPGGVDPCRHNACVRGENR